MNFPNKTALSFKKKYLINNEINSVYFVDLQSFCRSLIDKEYSKIINSKKSVVFSDGFSVHEILKKQGSVYYPGPEFLKQLLNDVDSLLFLGPNKTSIEKLKNILKNKSLNVKIDSIDIPFYENIVELDLASLVNEINKKDIKHVAVILGCPKQEVLINKLANEDNSYVFYGLGAAFNFFIESEKRVPEIFRNFKIEWLFRLLIHPKKQIPKYILVFKSIPALVKYYLKH
jgi:N-acetylglucosaminyldiphosphoundecaprenol N-acetyl-beta-D-mannosaminyltransferase